MEHWKVMPPPVIEMVHIGNQGVLSSLITDMHHFNNRGGHNLPMLHPDGSVNLAPGLIPALSGTLGKPTQSDEIVAFVAACVAHPAFTQHFADELTTPGIRVPITGDAALWGCLLYT